MERGTKVYIVFLSTVFSNKAIRGAVILFHDVTERHRAEKQRREFSANVSHELKTPLTTISALSEMIEQGIAKEVDIKSFAGRISEQSGRLLVLIDDIIRLSEFDEGKPVKENTLFSLWELAENVINALRDNAGNVEIQLTGERFDISANHRMIDELLYNLIDNGVKYNAEGGKVTVELIRIEDGLCKISVADTGIGIPKQHHPHVFERFYRVDRSRSKKTGGTGLGLSIVKHITEYYNGSLELESTEGIGTTVTCNLKS
jgi:two-component system phosphate regulon sensor histidine kinase PhoR